ncbi:MAG TPA: DUF4147 domain-containing protein [bacterium]|nr:DUF4147 domain-containing protein [bacterium]
MRHLLGPLDIDLGLLRDELPLTFDFDGPPPDPQRTALIALGKSARFMLFRFLATHPAYATARSIVIFPAGLTDDLALPSQALLIPSTHPRLTEKSFAAGRALIDFVTTHANLDHFVCLLSGGASALVEQSDDPASHIAWWRDLLHAGLPIEEMNRRRIARSAIKGGKLTDFAPHSRFSTFVMSDIPAESGYRLAGSMPFWRDGDERLTLRCIADCTTLHRWYEEKLRSQGYKLAFSQSRFAGTVAELAALITTEKSRLTPGEALLITGEPTLTVDIPHPGHGGRMAHLALLLTPELRDGETLYALSSDGIDGSSPHAGVIVTPEARKHFDLTLRDDHLARFDAYPFFERYGCAVKTGYTGINLNDAVVITRG